MCLTNIDIVDGIDCLQVLQHVDGSEIYLVVPTGKTCWVIGSTIASASAGGRCPAHVKSWRYWSDNGRKEGIINVKCSIHT